MIMIYAKNMINLQNIIILSNLINNTINLK